MRIDGNGCGRSRSVYKGWAERDVVDEMSVHHIEMQPVRARLLCPADFLMETAKVAGQNRWGDENGMHVGNRGGSGSKLARKKGRDNGVGPEINTDRTGKNCMVNFLAAWFSVPGRQAISI